MVDLVNKPPHYLVNGYETKDILLAYFPNDPIMFTAAQYILRAGRKGDTELDIDKCIFWLQEKKKQLREAESDVVIPQDIAAQLQRLEMTDD
jgi:hypothetical protein